ncbi:LEA type 2 family protein [Actinomycetospora endophytica]|uniref:LEA type 2 family protein n=1 Tax=Actinomycetospora endophytica TaxID=2291215 RepID=A0ABS8P5U5_9PSEU|nr:LEA type 2 family protein [Actinomycetospora endophytica]MCD2193630.1 LEA type 2 family protein [Actinomycetospora endophytica]
MGGCLAVVLVVWVTGVGNNAAGPADGQVLGLAPLGPPTLYPGSKTTYSVTVRNPNPYPVSVQRISASSSGATANGCAAGTVTSAQIDNPAGGIGPYQTATFPVPVAMSTDADNACQGQSFTLPFRVTLRPTP